MFVFRLTESWSPSSLAFLSVSAFARSGTSAPPTPRRCQRVCRDPSVVEINYLCVHKRLRSKRLAPVLIKEIARQCHLKGIFQPIYTAGIVIPTPISCRYYHRTLNVPKLVDVKFTYVPRDMTIARVIRQSKVPSTSSRVLTSGRWKRGMCRRSELYRRYIERFDMVPLFEEEDIRHQFLSWRGTGEREASTGRRPAQVGWTYVAEVRSRAFFFYVSFRSILPAPL